jgi:MoaA/NifB/PqqE/SkfB family radical SAM enzyme
MSEEKIRSTISEARELGISLMVIAGGEPLVREEIVPITREFPEILFLVFTNGLLLDEELVQVLRKQRNFVPVISLEGHEPYTDHRRGEGVHMALRRTMRLLERHKLFWSVSLTVTSGNLDMVTNDQFVGELVDSGCRLFFFLEYTPITEDTEDWVVTEKQRVRLLDSRDAFRSKYPALFVAVPGDEEEIGGCLSAGRGFIPVRAVGDVEPCPFAPYSDANLRDVSLREALQSDFLRAIRDNDERLSETEGGCALYAERDWVNSLLVKQQEIPR